MSSWIRITQEHVDTFAQITHANYNLIHQRGSEAKGSPFGKPIAQGMYILSLCDSFTHEVMSNNKVLFSSQRPATGINQGFNRVRFIAPCYVGSRCRGIYTLKSVELGKRERSLRFVFEIVVQTQQADTDIISTAAVVEFVSLTIYS